METQTHFSALPRPQGKKKILGIALGAVLIIFLGLFLIGSLSKSPEDEQVYEYKNPITVTPDHTFSYSFGFDPQVLESYKKGHQDYSDAVAVYSDPMFTKQVPTSYYDGQNKLEISAALSTGRAYNQLTSHTINLGEPKRWGLHAQYYLVQKRNMDSGKLLEKPIITPFRVKKQLAAPESIYAVDEQGIVRFSWPAVLGAQKYYIVKFTYPKEMAWLRLDTNIIGETTATEWSSADQDRQQPDKVFFQNNAFTAYKKSEDNIRHYSPAGVLAAESNVLNNTYGVIAFDGQSYSSVNETDGRQLESQLPQSQATFATQELGLAFQVDARTFDRIPTQIPVTMADGSTTMRPVIVKTEGILRGRIITEKGPAATIRVPYTVGGTKLSGYYEITEFNDATYPAEVARIAQRNKEAQLKGGGFTPYTYRAKRNTLANINVSKSAPKVDYKITATNSLSKHLAAHMIVGNEYIDVSKFAGDRNEVLDAAQEAITQNPYILNVKDMHFYEKERILEV